MSRSLRRSLEFPELNEDLVGRLTLLADELDEIAASSRPDDRNLRAVFNQLAGCELPLSEFHFSGASTADTFVREVLSRPHVRAIDELEHDEAVELTRRVMESEGASHEIHFWLAVLERCFPNASISDLIFWREQALEALDVTVSDPHALTPMTIVKIARAAAPPRIMTTPSPVT